MSEVLTGIGRNRLNEQLVGSNAVKPAAISGRTLCNRKDKTRGRRGEKLREVICHRITSHSGQSVKISNGASIARRLTGPIFDTMGERSSFSPPSRSEGRVPRTLHSDSNKWRKLRRKILTREQIRTHQTRKYSITNRRPSSLYATLTFLILLNFFQFPFTTACISLRANSACRGWSSMAVMNANVSLRLSYNPDPVSFDNSMRSIVGSVEDVNDFREFWSCPGYDGSRQRYRLSFLCSEILLSAENVQVCNANATGPAVSAKLNPTAQTDTLPSASHPPNPLMPLCKTTCATFVQSLEAILSNKTWCPDFSAKRNQSLELYRNLCDVFPYNGEPNACISGEVNEPTTCGYTYMKDQCETNCSQTDPQLCSDYLQLSLAPALPSTTQESEFPTATSRSTNDPQSDDEIISFALRAPVVIGIGLIMVLFAVALASCSFLVARRRYRGIGKIMASERGAALVGKTEKGSATFNKLKNDYKAVHPFKARGNDELSLVRGDIVTTHVHHSDGWATGFSRRSGKGGVFPMVCLEPVDGQANNHYTSRSGQGTVISKRTSSLQQPEQKFRDGIIPKRTTSHIRPESRDRTESVDEYFSEVYPVDAYTGQLKGERNSSVYSSSIGSVTTNAGRLSISGNGWDNSAKPVASEIVGGHGGYFGEARPISSYLRMPLVPEGPSAPVRSSVCGSSTMTPLTPLFRDSLIPVPIFPSVAPFRNSDTVPGAFPSPQFQTFETMGGVSQKYGSVPMKPNAVNDGGRDSPPMIEYPSIPSPIYRADTENTYLSIPSSPHHPQNQSLPSRSWSPSPTISLLPSLSSSQNELSHFIFPITSSPEPPSYLQNFGSSLISPNPQASVDFFSFHDAYPVHNQQPRMNVATSPHHQFQYSNHPTHQTDFRSVPPTIPFATFVSQSWPGFAGEDHRNSYHPISHHKPKRPMSKLLKSRKSLPPPGRPLEKERLIPSRKNAINDEESHKRLEKHMSRYDVNIVNIITVPKMKLRVVNG